jgi:hypothetical protein
MRAPLALGIALVALTVVPAVSAPHGAAASTSCWRAAIADWSANGTIDGRYSPACLRQAMHNAPTDLKIYSTLEDDLQAAVRLRSARHLAGADTHSAVASLDEPGRSSPVSELAMVLAGLAIFVVGSAAIATIARRRRAGR